MSFSVTNTVNRLIENKRINAEQNDVRSFSGWSRKIYTYQWRFGADEAQRLVDALRGYSKAHQAQLVRAFAKESKPLGAIESQATFPARIAFINAAAAAIMNAYAKELDVKEKFVVEARRSPTPRG